MSRTPSTVYLLDANVLIDAHNKYYAIDMVPEFWDWLLYSASEGGIAMPLETFEEVRGGADAKKDLLNEWLCRDAVEEALVLAEEVDTGILLRLCLPARALRCNPCRGFRDPKRTQAFLSSFGSIRQHFALKRHLLRASLHRKQLASRFAAWHEFTEVTGNPSTAF